MAEPDHPGQGVRSLLVVGAARSGKSAHAQGLAEASGLAPVYVATAQAFDAEMRARIDAHRAERDGRWTTLEAPLGLAEALAREASRDRVLLVDCLTLWLTNVMLAERDVLGDIDRLVALVDRLPGAVVFVTNEVGAGIVPDNALARRFRDAQGRLNQRMAAACEAAVLVVAGLPLVLKPAAAARPTPHLGASPRRRA